MSQDPRSIDPRAAPGYVHLTVADLARVRAFYAGVLGFREAWSEGTTVFLSASGRYPFHVALTPARRAMPASRRTAGLYHAAFLLPGRRALACVLRRLMAAGVQLDGASDHRVSEALYLRDPEGNGVELYADRPRDRWPRGRDQILMTTEPLDLHSLLSEAGGEEAGVDPGTRLGHVHLRVSDLGRAEAFYHGILGFDVTLRGYPGALFLSAGGYHHHLGVNIWGGQGLPPSDPEAPGLRYFSISLPTPHELARLVRRAEEAVVRIEGAADCGPYEAVYLRDWDGIGVALTVDRPVPAGAPVRREVVQLDLEAAVRRWSDGRLS